MNAQRRDYLFSYLIEITESITNEYGLRMRTENLFGKFNFGI
jgi:hypothetical protein